MTDDCSHNDDYNLSNGATGENVLESPVAAKDVTPFELNSEDLKFLQAIAFIEDAENYRSIHHKVDQGSLYIASVYNSVAVKWCRNFVIFLIHILAFFEFPSSLSLTSDLTNHLPSYEFPCAVLVAIEAFCLLTFLCDCMIKSYLIGSHNALRSKWIIAYMFVLVVSLIDYSVTLGFNCNETVRVRRFLRPFFILQNSYLMKKMVNCLRRTLPEVVSILLLLALHLYMFTLFGMLLFPTQLANTTQLSRNESMAGAEGQEYFETLFGSMLSLLVLLTTANNPDVTMPAYSRNRFYQIYFLLFLVIGLFCFMNMLTAVIYNQFRGYFLNSMQSSLFRRRVAVRAAFETLSYKMMSLKHSTDIPVYRSSVSRASLIHVIKNCRLKKEKKEAILGTLQGMSDSFITARQFQDLFHLLDIDVKKSQAPYPATTRFPKLRIVQKMILHKYFAYVGNVVAVSNVLFITVELSTAFSHTMGSKHALLRLINLVFIIYYFVEQSLKVWAKGVTNYLHSTSNVLDGVITMALVLVEIAYLIEFGIPYTSDDYDDTPSMFANVLWMLVRFINILITLRLLRIIPHIKAMSVVASTLIDLIRSMKSFAGIVVAMYYIFAILGLELFYDVIKPFNTTAGTPECGSFYQLNYTANNFNDFASALVVLWDIMLVNNWHVFLKAFADATSNWSYLYFIAWWLISVIIVLNLFTAIILENFIMKWDKSQRTVVSPHEASFSNMTHTLTLHDMFRDGLQEPTDQELLIEMSHHQYLDLPTRCPSTQ